MSDRFYALPVGHGDAFLYHRGLRHILVDGGGAGGQTTKLPVLLKRYLPKCDALDVVVCTHNDGDHALGLVMLLKERSVRVGELWLPGSWAYGLKRLLQAPHEVVRDLITDVDTVENPSGRPWNWFQVFADTVFDRVGAYKAMPASEDWVNTAVEQAVSQELMLTDVFALTTVQAMTNRGPGVSASGVKNQILISALRLAENIRQIALLAVTKGVHLRWFDYHEFRQTTQPSGGDTGVLEPVNACEIMPTPRNIRPLEYFSLTTSNKESLVFHSPVNGDSLGVLFCADSLLDFPLPSGPGGSMIVTASHHGAEANDRVYDVVEKHWPPSANQVVWVRSDANSKKRPCLKFRRVQGVRCCTVCRRGRLSKAAVVVNVRGGAWTPQATPCGC